ncbi:MAG: hypothetical protein WA984_16130 [Phormidesmis sp.]
MMKWLTATAAGLAAGLVMFIVLAVGTHTGMAPFNTPPSGAFLTAIGLDSEPLALLFHFGYAAAGSILLVLLFDARTGVSQGIGLALVLWLILMVVFSPIIGWGVFGVGGPNHALPPNSPLYLGLASKYIVLTLVLHIVYGGIIGQANHWINSVDEKSQS